MLYKKYYHAKNNFAGHEFVNAELLFALAGPREGFRNAPKENITMELVSF